MRRMGFSQFKTVAVTPNTSVHVVAKAHVWRRVVLAAINGIIFVMQASSLEDETDAYRLPGGAGNQTTLLLAPQQSLYASIVKNGPFGALLAVHVSDYPPLESSVSAPGAART